MLERFLVVISLGALVACSAGANPSPRSEGPVRVAVPASEGSDEEPLLVAAPAGPQPSSDIVPIDADDLVVGSPTAPVTLVEFTDLQCPFCSRVRPTLAELRRRYGPSELRFVMKHNPLPFHADAEKAAHFTQAVLNLGGAAAALEFAERAFREQRALNRDSFRTWIAELGLDPARVEAAADSPEVAAAVQRDMDLAKSSGALGTPNYFVNGVKVSGAQPLETFATEIEKQLSEARKLLGAGTRATDVYGALVARNFFLPEAKAPAPPEPPDLSAWKVPTAGAPARGAKRPTVTIVAFYDYQCPFSKRTQATIQSVLDRYPDDVRLIVRHNPLAFHPRARQAANLAIEARAQRGDAAFFEATRRLFESQPKLEDADLLAIAKELKLDQARVRAAITRGRHDAVIDADMDLASDLQARGVPHFFLNGVRLSGAQPLEAFVDAVERERSKASELTARGVDRGKIYAEIMKTAKGPDPLERKVVAIPADSPSRGPANAPIVIQIFAGFQCPFCKRVQATLTALDAKYPGQIRWVWRNMPFPFHQHSRQAARAALEARAQGGDRAFWTMHDQLFAVADASGLSERNLVAIAQGMGLDVARFEAALKDTKYDIVIDSDIAAANAAKISGTPAFLVNEYFVSGAQPINVFEKAIRHAKRSKPGKRAP